MARRRRAPGRGVDRLAWLVPLAAGLITALLLLLRWTTRRRTLHGEAVFAAWARGEQVILAFWHDRLVMMPLLVTGRRACIMVSQHRDGELIARAVRPLGVEAARGSSTRGWSGALKGMLRAYRAGADLAFAPDGPRGPRHVAKSGVVQVARATGAAIVPVGVGARRCWRLGSWDRLILPLPGTRIVYVGGPLLRVARDAGPEEIERVRGALDDALHRTSAEAEAVAQS